MSSYLERIEQAAPSEQWPLVRAWMDDEPLELYRELRKHRPVLELPEVTLVTRFHDCVSVLHRHESFSVRLYKAKQGEYWMAEDDTARHWREKSIMRSILDLEELPEIRSFVAETAATILRQAGGTIEAVNALARAVPIALVQQQFGFDESEPRKLFEWSYWNQYDCFSQSTVRFDTRRGSRTGCAKSTDGERRTEGVSGWTRPETRGGSAGWGRPSRPGHSPD